MNLPFDPLPYAQALAHAWAGAPRLAATEIALRDDAQAYAVQDALIDLLGPVGGWKVGCSDNTSEPNAAPLPARVVVSSGAHLACASRSLRIIELEVAVRLREDLLPDGRLLTRAQIAEAVETVLPVIEVVDTRLAQGREAPAPARLADLQSHAALVVGQACDLDPLALDMTGLRTRLWFNDQLAADVVGGHAAPDIWRLLAWLACVAQARGRPLRAGQVITTGACTPLLWAPPGAQVVGEVTGLGRVELTL